VSDQDPAAQSLGWLDAFDTRPCLLIGGHVLSASRVAGGCMASANSPAASALASPALGAAPVRSLVTRGSQAVATRLLVDARAPQRVGVSQCLSTPRLSSPIVAIASQARDLCSANRSCSHPVGRTRGCHPEARSTSPHRSDCEVWPGCGRCCRWKCAGESVGRSARALSQLRGKHKRAGARASTRACSRPAPQLRARACM
jgi:hypothetical protein